MDNKAAMDLVKKGLQDSAKVKMTMIESGMDQVIANMAQLCVEALESGGKLIVAGNGGSAADAQHIAAELVGRYRKDRKAFAAIALTTDTSAITAIANDMGYESVFSRQIEALGRKGDVFLAISTSGNSQNLVEALKKAAVLGLSTLCFTGGNGGAINELSDISLIIPTDDTPRIQEAHITSSHLICDLIERQLGG